MSILVSARAGVTTPVAHQKRPNRSAMNAIGLKQNDNKINQADCYPAAHSRWPSGRVDPSQTSIQHGCPPWRSAVAKSSPVSSLFEGLDVVGEVRDLGPTEHQVRHARMRSEKECEPVRIEIRHSCDRCERWRLIGGAFGIVLHAMAGRAPAFRDRSSCPGSRRPQRPSPAEGRPMRSIRGQNPKPRHSAISAEVQPPDYAD